MTVREGAQGRDTRHVSVQAHVGSAEEFSTIYGMLCLPCMASAKLMAMKLPIGSGAIESTVHRVVNLRLQGPSLCWCRASAEALWLLHSYDKRDGGTW